MPFMNLKNEMNLNNDYASHWKLDRRTLNHGSFGATPKAILERQGQVRTAFDSDREKFLWEGYFDDLARSREKLARFVGADTADLVYVDNVTEAVSSVFHSLRLGPGDELLVTDHAYDNYFSNIPGVMPFLKIMARRDGFTIRVAEIPYPVGSEDQVVETILNAATDKTTLAFIDHITSPTALVFPIKRIVGALKKRGIETFVDGAHAPGQVDLSINDIGAAYYAGNCHKWLCAPSGVGFLHVRKDKQDGIMPAVMSGGAGAKNFADRFAWTGTKDLTPRLLVGETIDYMASLYPQGWPGIRARNHALALAARDMLTQRIGIGKPCPDEMVGSFFTIPLSLKFDAETEAQPHNLRLSKVLEKESGIKAYAVPFGGVYLLRVSAHLYNGLDQYRELANAIASLVGKYGVEPSVAPASVPSRTV